MLLPVPHHHRHFSSFDNAILSYLYTYISPNRRKIPWLTAPGVVDHGNQISPVQKFRMGEPTTQTGAASAGLPPRPSIWWMIQPGYIDGSINPPQFYHNADEIRATWAHGWACLSVAEQHHVRQERAKLQPRAPPTTAPSPPPQLAHSATAQPQRPQATNVPTLATTVQSSAMEPTTAPSIMSHPVVFQPAAAQYASVAGPVQQVAVQPGPLRACPAPTPAPTLAPTPAGNMSSPENNPDFVTLRVGIAYKVAAKPTGGRATSGPPKMVIERESKLVYVKLTKDTTRSQFTLDILKAVDLGDKFTVGEIRGPAFKARWTGINAHDASTVETDDMFAIVRSTLLKDRPKNIFIDLDIDQMQAHRVRKRALDAILDDGDEQGAPSHEHGTKVPRVEALPELDRRLGQHILNIEKEWVCEVHRGKHNNPGHCFVKGDNHLPLNRRRKSKWAAALEAKTPGVDLRTPPEWPDFQGPWDGCDSAKPRGRTGPRPSSSTAPIVQAPTAPQVIVQNQSDVGQVMPVLANLIQQQTTLLSSMLGTSSPAPSDVAFSTSAPSSSSSLSFNSSSISSPSKSLPISPIPRRQDIIYYFLMTFYQNSGHNLLPFHEILVDAGYTPSVLSSSSDALQYFQEISGISDDVCQALAEACRSYSARLEEKKDIVRALADDDTLFADYD
ncbi:hypothetical protein OF83DRAFT_1180106 [Amylostereum chailletii]|nr:hypothetical protein OF83DRAFT_1180106 [Amylostereum chailletii]